MLVASTPEAFRTHTNNKTHQASPYFPFLSSGLNLSPEKQNRHDMVSARGRLSAQLSAQVDSCNFL